MEKPSPAFVYRHTRLGILTEQADDLVDLTEGLEALLTDSALSAGVLDVLSCQPGAGILVTTPSHVPPGGAAGDPMARLSIAGGCLQLDADARVFLVEHDGPAAREIAVVMVGEARR